MPARGGRERPSRARATHRRAHRQRSVPLGQQHEQDEKPRARCRLDAEHGVHQEDDDEIERHPRHIEQRRRPRARKEGSDLVEVAQRLQAVAACRCGEVGLDCRKHACAEARIEAVRRACHQTHAYEVERAAQRIEGEHRKRESRKSAAAGQDAVIDFPHIERAGEGEYVDGNGYEPGSPKGAAARAQRAPDGAGL
jgi:hypothetical protein